MLIEGEVSDNLKHERKRQKQGSQREIEVFFLPSVKTMITKRDKRDSEQHDNTKEINKDVSPGEPARAKQDVEHCCLMINLL